MIWISDYYYDDDDDNDDVALIVKFFYGVGKWFNSLELGFAASLLDLVPLITLI